MPQLSTPDLSKTLKSRKLGLPGTATAKPNILQYMMLGTLALLLVLGTIKMFSAPKTNTETIQVVAAGQDIYPGCKIDFSSLHYTSIPKRYYSPLMVDSYEKLVGKTSREFVKKGNPILKSDLLVLSTLASSLPKDKRAITLRLEPEFQVDHALRAGDRVDVLVTCSAQSGKKGTKKYTKTVCQDLSVLLSTPREALFAKSAKQSDANRITLAASSSDCEKLSQAAETGKLRLVLRSPANTGNDYLSGSDERDLIPAFALKEMAEEEAREANKTAAPALQAMPSFLPPPPAVASRLPQPPVEPVAAPNPVQWVVEMFSGSKRESYAIQGR